MKYTKKAEITSIIFKHSNEIPIIAHKWNDFALELWIQEQTHADEVKKKLSDYCNSLLKGVMLVIKWDEGERAVIF